MKVLFSILAVVATISSMKPAVSQVNMQYSGRYGGQYAGQHGGQFSGQYSGQNYGRGCSDQTASPNALDRKLDIFGYPVNSGSCGQLYYPSPGTDYVLHDRQGRRSIEHDLFGNRYPLFRIML